MNKKTTLELLDALMTDLPAVHAQLLRLRREGLTDTAREVLLAALHVSGAVITTGVHQAIEAHLNTDLPPVTPARWVSLDRVTCRLDVYPTAPYEVLTVTGTVHAASPGVPATSGEPVTAWLHELHEDGSGLRHTVLGPVQYRAARGRLPAPQVLHRTHEP